MTPKPTGRTRLVLVSNSTRAGTGVPARPSFSGAPVIGHRLGPAFERLAGQRDREHVEAVAGREGPQQRAEHLASGAACVAEIDQPVALAEPGQRRGHVRPALVRPEPLRQGADRAFQRVVEVGRRPDRAPEGVGEGSGALQGFLLQAQIGRHLFQARIENRRRPRFLQLAAHLQDALRRRLCAAAGRRRGRRRRLLRFLLPVAIEVPAER